MGTFSWRFQNFSINKICQISKSHSFRKKFKISCHGRWSVYVHLQKGLLMAQR